MAFTRALVATMLGHLQEEHPLDFARRDYPGQSAVVEWIKRNAVRPADTVTATGGVELTGMGLPDFVVLGVPGMASSNALTAGQQFDLGRYASLRVPYIESPAGGAFIGEGNAAPVINYSIGSGPSLALKKFAAIAVFTSELAKHSKPAIERSLNRLLGTSFGLATETLFFGSSAADAATPAGIFNGAAAALPRSTATTDAHLEDVANLIAAVDGVAGGNPILLIAAPGQAARLKLDPRVSHAYPIFSSFALPTKTCIALATNMLLVSSDPAPRFELSTSATVHAEDTTPAPISVAGTPNAISAPVISSFQQDLMAIKIVFRIDWVLASNKGLASIVDCAWGPQS